jgi:hypothetical protein
MSDSEFHSCKGGEAGRIMKPGAVARGVMKPPTAASQLNALLPFM